VTVLEYQLKHWSSGHGRRLVKPVSVTSIYCAMYSCVDIDSSLSIISMKRVFIQTKTHSQS